MFTRYRLCEILAETRKKASLGWGLRVASAITLPLLVSLLLGIPLLSWTSLGAFLVALGDPGGSDRARLRGTLGVAVSGAIATTVAAMAGRSTFVAGAAMLACAAAGALALRRGRAEGLLGALATEAFIVSLAAPLTPMEALTRGGAFAVGGLWAALLLVIVWPLRGASAARENLSQLVTSLASYTRALAQVASHPPATRPLGRVMVDEPRLVRARLVAAAAVVADELRHAPSGRAQPLDGLLGVAEECFALMLALADALDPSADGTSASAALLDALDQLEVRLHRLAGVLRNPRLGLARPLHAMATHGLDTPAGVLARQLHACLDEGEELLAAGASSAAELAVTGAFPVPRAAAAAPSTRRAPSGVPWLVRVRRWWADPVIRHALRLGVLCAGVVWSAPFIGIERPQWITLTILFSLQPTASATWSITRGRVIGTAIGAVLISIIGGAMSPLVLSAGVFVLTATGVALLEVNYAAFCLFLTPLAVLLADPAGGRSITWHLANVRLLDTCLGGALTLAAAQFLWHDPEFVQLRARVADVVLTVRDYLHAALVAGATAAPAEIAASRREVGAALLAAESHLAIARAHGDREASRLGELVDDLQRLALSITTRTCLPSREGEEPEPRIGLAPLTSEEWRAAVAGWFVLHRAAEAVRDGRSLDEQDSMLTVVDSSPLRRILDQLAEVRAAVAKAA